MNAPESNPAGMARQVVRKESQEGNIRLQATVRAEHPASIRADMDNAQRRHRRQSSRHEVNSKVQRQIRPASAATPPSERGMVG